VDDGSRDRTAEIVRERAAAAAPFRLLSYPDGRNRGKGAAVRLGMLTATGRYRLFMDADNSTTIQSLESFWPFVEQGYDIVFGSRAVEHAHIVEQQPWYKQLAGRAGNKLIQAMVLPGVADSQAGFKLFTARCAQDLFSRLTIDRWGFDIELLALAKHRDYRLKEVPITWTNDRSSKVKLRSYFEVFADVWHVRRNLRAGRYR
jgi:dolichyl-phosphate beta-glucosyltransferase